MLFNTTYTRDADGEVRWLDGYYEDWLWLESRTKWAEQYLAHFRLSGEHEIPWFLSSNLKWSASYGKAEREEPDRATLLWANSTPEDTFYQLFDQKSGGNRFWELTQDDNFSFSWDWTKDFKQWSGLPAKLKIGWAQENTDRENEMWFYDVTNITEKPYYGKEEIIQSRPFDNILDSAAAVKLSDKQSYWADKTITAGYLQIDMPIYQPLRMIAGTRVEKTDNEIRLYPTGSGLHPDPSRLRRVNKKHTDWLPSMNLTYSLMDRMNLRLALSKTLTRPEYFELIEREDRELFENLKSYGNPQLEHTLISNYDLRWEFYSRPGELFAISYFHKNLRRPIEYIYIQKGTQTLKPINTKEARNSGLELEIRKQLDFIWSRLSNLSINANYAIIRSKIKIDETGSNGFVLTNSQRPLTGQSPFVVNIALGYENKLGTNFRLLYNRFGERIAYPGTNGDPDIKEQPFGQLDFSIEQRLFKGIGCKLNATNLLNQEVKFNQGDRPWRSYKKGTSFSLGLSYSI
jgi:TonB-dependent receptor